MKTIRRDDLKEKKHTKQNGPQNFIRFSKLVTFGFYKNPYNPIEQLILYSIELKIFNIPDPFTV
jgi:hypothetical protein